MSTLSGSSTDQEVWESYDDNASFEEDASTTKAEAYITACRILLRRRPRSLQIDGKIVAFDTRAIREQLDRALTWLAANRAGNAGGVRYLDFGNLRS